MGTQENIALVRRGYDAFSSGDMTTLGQLFAEDAVWNSPGTGVISGRSEGRDAILATFGELFTRSNGTFKVNVTEFMGGDQRVVALHHAHGERDGKVLDEDQVNVFMIEDGVVHEVQQFVADSAADDAFWQ
jgi:ketosteroid isomerase-like protein